MPAADVEARRFGKFSGQLPNCRDEIAPVMRVERERRKARADRVRPTALHFETRFFETGQMERLLLRRRTRSLGKFGKPAFENRPKNRLFDRFVRRRDSDFSGNFRSANVETGRVRVAVEEVRDGENRARARVVEEKGRRATLRNDRHKGRRQPKGRRRETDVFGRLQVGGRRGMFARFKVFDAGENRLLHRAENANDRRMNRARRVGGER